VPGGWGRSLGGWVVDRGWWLVAGGWLVTSELAEMVGGEASVVVMVVAVGVSVQGHWG